MRRKIIFHGVRASLADKIILHPVPGYSGNKLFEPCMNDWHLSYVELRRHLEEEGYEVFSYPDVDLSEVDGKRDIQIVFDHQGGIGIADNKLCDRSILVMLEPPVVQPHQYTRIHGLPYTRILTYALDYVDNRKIFYSHFPIVRYRKPIEGKHDRHICAISGNKSFKHPQELYTARRLAYLAFGKDLDLYGHGWGTDVEMINTVNYLGQCEDKVQTLSKYQFAIVFENMLLRGWCSEKYWDCIMAGTVPIYRGWRPEGMTIDDVDETAWSRRILSHLKAITKNGA